MTTSTGADDAVFDSGSNSRSLTADPSSPYFLHHSDNPEEHQRKVGVPTNNATDVSTTMAFAAKVNVPDRRSNDGPGYRGQRKDRPYCTHCKIHGHTIDRCFKIHGYPPGYKPKPRDNSFSNMSSNSVNVGANPVNQVSGYAMQTDQSSPSTFFQNLNSNQYQQLMTMLSTHLSSPSKSGNEAQTTTTASFTTGYVQPEDDWQGIYDIHSKQVFVSRDVVFHEEIFPFHTIVTSESLVDPFPDFVLHVPATSVGHSSSLTSPPDLFPSVSDPENFFSDRVPSSSAANDMVDTVDTLPMASTLAQPDAALRRSSRVSHPPSFLKDFHCNLVSQQDVSSLVYSPAFPLNDVLSYNALSPSYRNFILNVSSHYEPQFFHQAVGYPEWRAAMKAANHLLRYLKNRPGQGLLFY
ncbi:hypothetical protein LWI28_004620 [Acer negundo]|uniref:Uncharacterized protein n=1 Tax=Acer negundo TaxID=4023 RepID=A0AAD5IC10_ACENE|nr:hypothetical protein LWI28_004620 [Acer negundo]